jgi:hypothetical protein
MNVRKTAMLLAALLACSSDETPAPMSSSANDSQTMTIGPEGGAIVVGGATVTFPKDAVASPVQITISEQEAGFPTGFETLSHLFKCEPSGTNFVHPVTMQMPFTDDGKGPATIFWSSGADPTFKDVGGTVQGTTMITTVEHFSSGFVGRRK